MATPTQHRTIAEAYDTRLHMPGLTEPTVHEQLVAEIHAILATKAGTGTHYTQAETILQANPQRHAHLTAARIHAHLADPA